MYLLALTYKQAMYFIIDVVRGKKPVKGLIIYQTETASQAAFLICGYGIKARERHV